MANDGFIKLYRKMTQWGWYKDQNTKDVFLHLLLEACYEPCYFRNTRLEIGQVATTVKEIKEKTGINEQPIRTSLKKLISTNEITIKTTNKYSIITLLNYAEYQGTNNQSNKQLTNNQQTTNKQPEKEKEKKKERSKERKKEKEKENKEVKEYYFSSLSQSEVEKFCEENALSINCKKFLAHYERIGWLDKNGNQITDWKAAAVYWSMTERKPKATKNSNKEKPSFDLEALEQMMKESDCVI